MGAIPQAHHEAQDDGQRDEEPDRKTEVELDRTVNTGDRVPCLRVAHDKEHHQRDDERRIHHEPGAPFVGHPAAKCAEDRAGQRVQTRENTRRRQFQPVRTDIVARQEAGQGDECAKDKEVIGREAPDLQVPKRFQLRARRDRPLARLLALLLHWVGLGEQIKQHRSGGESDRIDPRRAFPAHGDNQERGGKVRHRSADVPSPENAQRRALMLFVEPARGVGDADDERASGQSQAKRCDQEDLVGLHRCQQPDTDRRDQHLQGKHDAPAELLGPDAEEDPADRSGQDRCRDKQAKLRIAQAEVLLNLDADDRENRPDCKANRKSESAEAQRTILIRARNAIKGVHVCPSRNLYFRPMGRLGLISGLGRAGRDQLIQVKKCRFPQ